MRWEQSQKKSKNKKKKQRIGNRKNRTISYGPTRNEQTKGIVKYKKEKKKRVRTKKSRQISIEQKRNGLIILDIYLSNLFVVTFLVGWSVGRCHLLLLLLLFVVVVSYDVCVCTTNHITWTDKILNIHIPGVLKDTQFYKCCLYFFSTPFLLLSSFHFTLRLVVDDSIMAAIFKKKKDCYTKQKCSFSLSLSLLLSGSLALSQLNEAMWLILCEHTILYYWIA